MYGLMFGFRFSTNTHSHTRAHIDLYTRENVKKKNVCKCVVVVVVGVVVVGPCGEEITEGNEYPEQFGFMGVELVLFAKATVKWPCPSDAELESFRQAMIADGKPVSEVNPAFVR